jgi:hypothetical protein
LAAAVCAAFVVTTPGVSVYEAAAQVVPVEAARPVVAVPAAQANIAAFPGFSGARDLTLAPLSGASSLSHAVSLGRTRSPAAARRAAFQARVEESAEASVPAAARAKAVLTSITRMIPSRLKGLFLKGKAAGAAEIDGKAVFDGGTSLGGAADAPVQAGEASPSASALARPQEPGRSEPAAVPAPRPGFLKNLGRGLGEGDSSMMWASAAASGWLGAMAGILAVAVPAAVDLVPGMLLAALLPAGIYFGVRGAVLGWGQVSGFLPSWMRKGSPEAAFAQKPEGSLFVRWLKSSFPKGSLKPALWTLAASAPVALAGLLAPALALGPIQMGLFAAAVVPAALYLVLSMAQGTARLFWNSLPSWLRASLAFPARVASWAVRFLAAWMARSFGGGFVRGAAGVLVASAPAAAAALVLKSIGAGAAFMPGLLVVAALPGAFLLAWSLLSGLLSLAVDLLPEKGASALRAPSRFVASHGSVEFRIAAAHAAGWTGLGVALGTAAQMLLGDWMLSLEVFAAPAGLALLAQAYRLLPQAARERLERPLFPKAFPESTRRLGAAVFATMLPLAGGAALAFAVPEMLPLQYGLLAASVLPAAVFVALSAVFGTLRSLFGLLPEGVRTVLKAPFLGVGLLFKGLFRWLSESFRKGSLAPLLWTLGVSGALAGASFLVPSLAGLGLIPASLGLGDAATLVQAFTVAASLPISAYLSGRLLYGLARLARRLLPADLKGNIQAGLDKEFGADLRQARSIVEKAVPESEFGKLTAAALLTGPMAAAALGLYFFAPASVLLPGLLVAAVLPVAHFALGIIVRAALVPLLDRPGMKGGSLIQRVKAYGPLALAALGAAGFMVTLFAYGLALPAVAILAGLASLAVFNLAANLARRGFKL